ncbi:hypothetical protein [Gloeocapsopsis sp. IPPAS B-1203]|uniref:hypothetical protein n=1 Tax=Gloeocapsopsis sp. IPPAS B-1203 TaxID=2049454 RepID=UPI0025A1BAFD|nr:hypothetical protein [Gloeocapsopsis sp. IPPAS B-1203]
MSISRPNVSSEVRYWVNKSINFCQIMKAIALSKHFYLLAIAYILIQGLIGLVLC